MNSPPRSGFGFALFVSLLVLVLDGAAQSDLKSAQPWAVEPAHDPPDIPFRRAPMGLSSRSIAVSLATNWHLAFDAALLRTHTVWEGAPLNLYGPPFNGSANRFTCDFTGTLLWETLPVQPWELAGSDSGGFQQANPRFLGVSVSGGRSSFLYELVPAAGAPARVRETPRAEQILSRTAVVRRFEVAPLSTSARFSTFYGAGEFVRLPGLESALAIRRAKDFLLVAARGLESNVLLPRKDDAARVVLVQSERDGKGPYSAVVTNAVSGPQTQLTLTLSRSAKDQVVEVATLVCADPAEARALANAFAAPLVQPSTFPSLASAGKEASATPPKIWLPDPKFVDKPAGDESFVVEHFPVPKEINLLVGGLDFLANGDLAVCTYTGEVWIVEAATGAPAHARWRRFARGLNEPGGLRVIGGQIYVTQKCELTRLVDTDGDGEADLFECLSDGWGYTGNYHSYATGPLLDALGNFHVMITGHRTIYDVPFMGWCLKVSPPGTAEATTYHPTEGFCSGLRVPNGFGEFNGDLFMTDNQGHWIAANKLNHLQAGNFYGHPSARPSPPSRFKGDPDFTPPAVWFPYAWVRSASGIATIADDRFGPFKGQMLVGEFQNASVVRVALEKIDGQWQGAVFQFVKGFASGVNRIAFGPDGKLYAGGLRMGHWTSIAPQPCSLDRARFTGRIPFEIHEVRAQPDGFALTFTKPVDAVSAGDTENWDAAQYRYAYDGQHNAPEKDRDEKIPGPPARVTKAIVSADRRTVRLRIEGCQPHHVILVRALDVKNIDGEKLRHDTFHYTLNRVPTQ